MDYRKLDNIMFFLGDKLIKWLAGCFQFIIMCLNSVFSTIINASFVIFGWLLIYILYIVFLPIAALVINFSFSLFSASIPFIHHIFCIILCLKPVNRFFKTSLVSRSSFCSTVRTSSFPLNRYQLFLMSNNINGLLFQE